MVKLAACVLLLCVLLPFAKAEGEEIDISSAVKILTEANFEHDTQAATGGTTGDWFVKFYAPWCGHCKRLVEPWEQLAKELKQERENGEAHAIIAKVDATIEKSLQERFEVKGFPTLLMFSKGQMYKYSGARDVASLKAFAKGGFKDSTGERVPLSAGDMPLADKLKKKVLAPLEKDMKQIWKLHKLAFFVAGAGFFLVGMIFGCCLKPSGKNKEKQN
eukprot:CAMPEP_0181308240 /NCGR_PEP_ID=MMETSP1101-20121128/11349_1 /TAXON_ID=46948 /ORGANISM="Rhodomonas abbreviata, Strain Caron Lab Isolate" /LENGTH=217 /DNA_ID=CAMNT_0023414593 /DNA_START=18 /DNA_END=671 /DNA_ORIENTATION=-